MKNFQVDIQQSTPCLKECFAVGVNVWVRTRFIIFKNVNICDYKKEGYSAQSRLSITATERLVNEGTGYHIQEQTLM
jgi:hypothetical protein